MKKRLTVLRTNQKTGLAFYGTIAIGEALPFRLGEWQGPFEKSHEEASQPHHPESAGFNEFGKAIYLEVLEGTYFIYVANDGVEQLRLSLGAGDAVLFMDFECRDVSPDIDKEFSYTGHWSQADKGGAKIRVAVVEQPVDLEALDYRDGLEP